MSQQDQIFVQNKIFHEARLENFLIILTDTDNDAGTIADLPSIDDVLNVIKPKNPANM